MVEPSTELVALQRWEANRDDLSAWQAVMNVVAPNEALTDPALTSIKQLLMDPDEDRQTDGRAKLREFLKEARPLEVLTPSNEPYYEQREWILDPWLPANRVAIFTGEGGKGKSYLSLQLAAAVASGSHEWLKMADWSRLL